MAHTDKTALLDTATWEFQKDSNGDILLATGALAVAQNCANQIRLWTNDAYFQKDGGISYKEALLAQKLDESLFKQLIREQCLTVEGVATVDTVDVVSFDKENRILHGKVEITTTENQTASVIF